MEKAESSPPLDSDGIETSHKELVISQDEIGNMIKTTLTKVLEYLYIEKTTYLKKLSRE